MKNPRINFVYILLRKILFCFIESEESDAEKLGQTHFDKLTLTHGSRNRNVCLAHGERIYVQK
jgi:hypothetical protein